MGSKDNTDINFEYDTSKRIKWCVHLYLYLYII